MGRKKKDDLPKGIYKTTTGYKIAYRNINNDLNWSSAKTLEDAIELKASFDRIRELGIDLDMKNPTVTNLFLCFVKIYKMPNVTVTTFNSIIRRYNNHIKDKFGNADIRDLKKPHIQSFVDELQIKVSPEYTKKIVYLLKCCYNLAIYLGIVNCNQCDYIEWRSSKAYQLAKREMSINYNKNTSKYVPKNIAYKYIELLNIDVYKKVIEFQYETGLRCGEVLALTLDKIDFKRRKIKVYNTLAYDYYAPLKKNEFIYTSTKTIKSFREIPVSKRAIDIILSVGNIENSFDVLCGFTMKDCHYETVHNFIFIKDNSLIKVNSIDSALTTAMNKNNREYLHKQAIGIPVDDMMLLESHSSHHFRHTFLSNIWNKTKDPILLRDLAGHTSSDFTLDTYVVTPDDYLQSIIEDL